MRAVLVLALVLAACGSAAAPVSGAAPSQPPQPSPTATPIPTLNIFQLMGGAPATTVFAFAGTRVRAVRLLDHFVKYEIAVNGGTQLLATLNGASLVVADQPGAGIRLRAFDVATGTERTSAVDDAVPAKLVASGSGRGSLAEDKSGRILALKSNGAGSWVDAYDGTSLRLVQRRVIETQGCAERLLAANDTTAIVCLRDGTATVGVAGGTTAFARLAPGELAGAVILQDGSLAGVTSAGDVYRLRPPNGDAGRYGRASGDGQIPRDGIAVAEEQIVVARGGSTPSVQIVPVSGTSRPLPVPVTPAGGLLAASPFAYFTSAGALYHVDLNTGNVERMTGGFENDAVPAALVAR